MDAFESMDNLDRVEIRKRLNPRMLSVDAVGVAGGAEMRWPVMSGAGLRQRR